MAPELFPSRNEVAPNFDFTPTLTRKTDVYGFSMVGLEVLKNRSLLLSFLFPSL